MLRAFTALAWAEVLGSEGCFAMDELRWLLEVAPAEHVAWAFQGIRIHDLFAQHLADPLVKRVREQLAVVQTEPGLRAHLLYLDILDAEQRGDTESVRSIYAKLIRDFGSSYSAQLAKESFDPERPLQIGRAMPSWSFIGLDGETIRSADYHGRPYLLEVWATWCGPCIDEMQSVHAAWDTLGGEAGPVSFVWVSIDNSVDQVREFRRERFPMPWTHAHQPDPQVLFDAWWFGGIPMAVLVDGDGRIAATGEALRGDGLLAGLLRLTASDSHPTSH